MDSPPMRFIVACDTGVFKPNVSSHTTLSMIDAAKSTAWTKATTPRCDIIRYIIRRLGDSDGLALSPSSDESAENLSASVTAITPSSCQAQLRGPACSLGHVGRQ